MPPSGEDIAAGDGLVNLDFAGTGVIVATSTAGAALPDTFGVVHAVASTAAFVVGSGAFLWAYAVGVSRSRAERVTLGGLFFLARPAAPKVVRFRFRVALVVQVVAVVTAASVRLYTNVAFGVLAPLLGLGLMALWGARHGEFAPKPAAERDAG